jgi:hypothetical protein
MDTETFNDQWEDFVGGLIDRGFTGIENIAVMGGCSKDGYHYLHFVGGSIIYSNTWNHEEAERNLNMVTEFPFENFDWDKFDKIVGEGSPAF